MSNEPDRKLRKLRDVLMRRGKQEIDRFYNQPDSLSRDVLDRYLGMYDKNYKFTLEESRALIDVLKKKEDEINLFINYLKALSNSSISKNHQLAICFLDILKNKEIYTSCLKLDDFDSVFSSRDEFEAFITNPLYDILHSLQARDKMRMKSLLSNSSIRQIVENYQKIIKGCTVERHESLALLELLNNKNDRELFDSYLNKVQESDEIAKDQDEIAKDQLALFFKKVKKSFRVGDDLDDLVRAVKRQDLINLDGIVTKIRKQLTETSETDLMFKRRFVRSVAEKKIINLLEIKQSVLKPFQSRDSLPQYNIIDNFISSVDLQLIESLLDYDQSDYMIALIESGIFNDLMAKTNKGTKLNLAQSALIEEAEQGCSNASFGFSPLSAAAFLYYDRIPSDYTVGIERVEFAELVKSLEPVLQEILSGQNSFIEQLIDTDFFNKVNGRSIRCALPELLDQSVTQSVLLKLKKYHKPVLIQIIESVLLEIGQGTGEHGMSSSGVDGLMVIITEFLDDQDTTGKDIADIIKYASMPPFMYNLPALLETVCRKESYSKNAVKGLKAYIKELLLKNNISSFSIGLIIDMMGPSLFHCLKFKNPLSDHSQANSNGFIKLLASNTKYCQLLYKLIQIEVASTESSCNSSTTSKERFPDIVDLYESADFAKVGIHIDDKLDTKTLNKIREKLSDNFFDNKMKTKDRAKLKNLVTKYVKKENLKQKIKNDRNLFDSTAKVSTKPRVNPSYYEMLRTLNVDVYGEFRLVDKIDKMATLASIIETYPVSGFCASVLGTILLPFYGVFVLSKSALAFLLFMKSRDKLVNVLEENVIKCFFICLLSSIVFALSPLYIVAQKIFFHPKTTCKKITSVIAPSNNRGSVSSSDLRASGNVASSRNNQIHSIDNKQSSSSSREGNNDFNKKKH